MFTIATMMGPLYVPFLVLLVLGPLSSEARHTKRSDTREHQEALNGLLSRLGTQNASDSGLVFMPPTFSVDIVSLLRWAVERDTQRPSVYPNIARYGGKTGGQSPPSFYNWQNINVVALGGKQYFVSRNQKATWFDALSFCRSFGMDLVSIESLEENNLLVNHLESIGLTQQYVFTSGHKVGRSTYIWLNGEQLVYEDWNAGEPAQFTTENCLIVWKRHWFDLPCDYATYFVCEG